MKHTKSFFILLSVLFTLTLLSACGNQPSTDTDTAAPEHTHAALEGWDRDLSTHWQLCECGEAMNAAEHTLEDILCSVCNSEIWAYDDGGGDIFNYDGNGIMVRTTSYNNIGTVTSDYRCIIEYDDANNPLRDEQYENGILIAKNEYARSSTGESYEAKQTYYEADSTYSIYERNEYGNTLLYSNYAADGTVLNESSYEYAQTPDGDVYESRCVDIYYDTGVKYVSERNQYGDQTFVEEQDLDGNLLDSTRWEREYNADGDPLWEKTYRNDRLSSEITGYATWSDDFGWSRFPIEVIDYIEDGSRLVTIYTEQGEIQSESTYAPSGEPVSETVYSYEYDAEGNRTSRSTTENGRLVKLEEYTRSADGWTICARCVTYAEDGSYTVTEYDENEDPISETTYDAGGNVIG